ncbi:DUF4942 domain-containing protein [Vibrio anguillarum]|nr:DUF4942 domain-containing protein [Vibrio anguillarum]
MGSQIINSTALNTDIISIVPNQTNIAGFNPSMFDGLTTMLIESSKNDKHKAMELAHLMKGYTGKVQCYTNQNVDSISKQNRSFSINSDEEIQKKVDSEYWKRFLSESKLASFLDAKERNAWDEQLRLGKDVPEFTIESINQHLTQFVVNAEANLTTRVINCLTKLSKEHKTNSSAGFRHRMIFDNCDSSYDVHYKSYYVHDLRCLIAFFHNQSDIPTTNSTSSVLSLIFNNPGQWHTIDGGTMRIKGFKKRTVHIEIEESIADKLNLILAKEFPNCLPNASISKPLFKSTLVPSETMLSNALRERIKHVQTKHPKIKNPQRAITRDCAPLIDDTTLYTLELLTNQDVELVAVERECIALLNGIFGSGSYHQNTYKWALQKQDPRDILKHLSYFGTLPDAYSHQFFQSTDRIKGLINPLLNIKRSDDILEPSAGQGALAKLLPQSQTTCIEINTLNCRILESHGFNVIQDDFLTYAYCTEHRYDWVIMNPPFYSNTYWKHIQAAMQLLKPAGKIIVVAPASLKQKLVDLSSDFTSETKHEITEQFNGTSKLNIVIALITRNSIL